MVSHGGKYKKIFYDLHVNHDTITEQEAEE